VSIELDDKIDTYQWIEKFRKGKNFVLYSIKSIWEALCDKVGDDLVLIEISWILMEIVYHSINN